MSLTKAEENADIRSTEEPGKDSLLNEYEACCLLNHDALELSRGSQKK